MVLDAWSYQILCVYFRVIDGSFDACHGYRWRQENMLRGKYRQLSRTVTETPPTESGIFYAPIDEDELSDCILKIIERFYGTSENERFHSL